MTKTPYIHGDKFRYEEGDLREVPSRSPPLGPPVEGPPPPRKIEPETTDF